MREGGEREREEEAVKTAIITVLAQISFGDFISLNFGKNLKNLHIFTCKYFSMSSHPQRMFSFPELENLASINRCLWSCDFGHFYSSFVRNPIEIIWNA